MATTRDALQAELERRLGDTSNLIWSDSDVAGALDFAVKSLYPVFFRRRTETSAAGAGPIQEAPAGARNIYMIGLQRTGSTRVRPLRQWTEGDGEAFVPKTGITGETLVWAWTEGWSAPSTGGESITIPVESEEVVLLRAECSLLEKLLVDRVSAEKYLAVNVRSAATEEDIASAIEAIHDTLRERTTTIVPLPEVRQ